MKRPSMRMLYSIASEEVARFSWELQLMRRYRYQDKWKCIVSARRWESTPTLLKFSESDLSVVASTLARQKTNKCHWQRANGSFDVVFSDVGSKKRTFWEVSTILTPACFYNDKTRADWFFGANELLSNCFFYVKCFHVKGFEQNLFLRLRYALVI